MQIRKAAPVILHNTCYRTLKIRQPASPAMPSKCLSVQEYSTRRLLWDENHPIQPSLAPTVTERLPTFFQPEIEIAGLRSPLSITTNAGHAD